jgi:hypothetical protein
MRLCEQVNGFHRTCFRLGTPAGLCLAVWMLIITCGYCQSAHFVNPVNSAREGWIIGPRFSKLNVTLEAQNIHAYLSTGDRGYLTSHGPIPLFDDIQLQKQMADDPAIFNVLPPAIRPVTAPIAVNVQGKGVWPVITADNPLLNTTRFGVSARRSSTPFGSLQLTYRFQANQRYFVISPFMPTLGVDDLALYLRTGNDWRPLIPPAQRDRIIDGPLYFHVDQPVFELEVVDQGKYRGGTFSITSPVPVGPITYWTEQLLPLSPLLAVAGFLAFCQGCWLGGALEATKRNPALPSA